MRKFCYITRNAAIKNIVSIPVEAMIKFYLVLFIITVSKNSITIPPCEIRLKFFWVICNLRNCHNNAKNCIFSTMFIVDINNVLDAHYTCTFGAMNTLWSNEHTSAQLSSYLLCVKTKGVKKRCKMNCLQVQFIWI